MSATVAGAACPYRGLVPFGDSELDAVLFFGRDREREIIVANLMASRLTLLYGPSGVGKSSLLSAGVAYHVRRLAAENVGRGEPPQVGVVVFSHWSEEPVGGIIREAADEVERLTGERPGLEPDVTLADALDACAHALGGELYVVLDQAEEYFVYRDRNGRRDRFAAEFAEAVERRDVRAQFVLSLREDELARLDAFKAAIPGLFGNYLRLDRLDRRAAREAIEGPLREHNRLHPATAVAIEPELVDAVLDQVSVGRLVGVAGGDPTAPADAARIEAPYLQLVMQRIWEAEEGAGSTVLRAETLEGLGGADRIVGDHLERALAELSPDEKDAAASMFTYLVTPSGSKIAHAPGDLADYAGVDPGRAQGVLRSLADQRIVRPVDVPGGGGARYEIFHDVLGNTVLAWRSAYVAERRLAEERAAARRKQRQLFLIAAAALVGLVVVGSVAVYAWAQRSDARESARLANARELEARASVVLSDDPQRSLALAVRSAALEPTPGIEEVLRRALLTDQSRRTWNLGEPVTLVRYSPDGKRIAAASGDRVVFSSPAGGAEHVARLDGSPLAAAFDRRGWLVVATAAGVQRVDPASDERLRVFTPAGRLVAAWFDARASLAAVATETDVIVLRPETRGARRVRSPDHPVQLTVTPDGQTLAVVGRAASGRVTTRLYDTGTGRPLAHLRQRGVRDVEFSPDGELLATASADGSTYLWESGSGRPIAPLDDRGGSIADLAFDSEGALLATASSDGVVRVWDVETHHRLWFFVGHGGGAARVAFAPEPSSALSLKRNLLASLSADGTGRLWFTRGTEQGRAAARLVGHVGVVTALAFAPDGYEMVTGGDDGTARLWNASIVERSEPLGQVKGPVLAVDFGRDGRGAVAVSGKGLVRSFPLDGGAPRSLRDGPPIHSASFAETARLTLVAGTAGRATLWRPGRATLLDHGSPISAVAVAGLGGLVATAGVDGSLRLWSPTGEARGAVRERSRITCVAVSRDGKWVAAGGADGVVRMWAADGLRRVATRQGHAGPIVDIAFSPAGDRLVSAGEDAVAVVWTVTGTRVHEFREHTKPLTDAAFDPTGTRILTTSEGPSRNAMLWDARGGRLITVLVGHFSTASSADFSADGRWAVTTGPLSAILWRASDGHRLGYVRGHGDHLTAAAFAPRGWGIATAARDGTVRAYECELCARLGRLVALARQRLAATAG